MAFPVIQSPKELSWASGPAGATHAAAQRADFDFVQTPGSVPALTPSAPDPCTPPSPRFGGGASPQPRPSALALAFPEVDGLAAAGLIG